MGARNIAGREERGAGRWRIKDLHSVRIHGFSGVEIKVLEIRRDVLDVIVLRPLLEGLDLFLVGAVLLEFLHYFLQICYVRQTTESVWASRTYDHLPL